MFTQFVIVACAALLLDTLNGREKSSEAAALCVR